MASDDDAQVSFMSAGDIKRGSFLLLPPEAKRKSPCKVVEVSTSKTGKHGGCKVHVIALDIFTGRKFVENFMSSDRVDVPEVKKGEIQVIGYNRGVVKMVDHHHHGEVIELKLDEEEDEKIAELMSERAPVAAMVVEACGHRSIVSVREKQIDTRRFE